MRELEAHSLAFPCCCNFFTFELELDDLASPRLTAGALVRSDDSCDSDEMNQHSCFCLMAGEEPAVLMMAKNDSSITWSSLEKLIVGLRHACSWLLHVKRLGDGGPSGWTT